MSISERPAIMQAHSIRGILDGRKTQTRRVVNLPSWSTGDWEDFDTDGKTCEIICANTGCLADFFCPYGRSGDRLWVREAHAIVPATAYRQSIGVDHRVSPDGHSWAVYREGWERSAPVWKPSIHMPRWAARITLEICSVRVERLQDISVRELVAEGVWECGPAGPGILSGDFYVRNCPNALEKWCPVWDSINGKKPGCSWADNCWVWVIEFIRRDS